MFYIARITVQYNFFFVLEGSTIVLEGSIFKWNFLKLPGCCFLDNLGLI